MSMVKLFTLTLFAGALAWVAAPAALAGSCSSCGTHGASKDKADKTAYNKADKADIVDTAAQAGSFSTLVAAVQAAGLEETLRGEGPFTVFAPTDEAFAALPEGTIENLLKPENRDKLVAVLTYHVVPGKHTAQEVVTKDEIASVQGGTLSIQSSDDGVQLNDANIVQTDIHTANGVIHVIDRVVLPTDL